MAPRVSAIQLLKNAARLKLVKKTVVLSDGTELSFWHKPLVLAERQEANKAAGDDSFEFALQLLISKAKYEDGSPMFMPGQMAELRLEVRDSDLQKLMSAVITDEDVKGGTDLDLKSGQEGAD